MYNNQFSVCLSLLTMWGAKENPIAVIALHKCGKSASELFKKLKISKMFFYCTIDRFFQTSTIDVKVKWSPSRGSSKFCHINCLRTHMQKYSWKTENYVNGN